MGFMGVGLKFVIRSEIQSKGCLPNKRSKIGLNHWKVHLLKPSEDRLLRVWKISVALQQELADTVLQGVAIDVGYKL